MKISLDLKDLDKQFKEIEKGIIEETQKEFIYAGSAAFENSLQLVPVDTGRLRQSLLMTVNSSTYLRGPNMYDNSLRTRYYPLQRKLENDLTIMMSYDTPYARRQHEEHMFRSKFLEWPCYNKFDVRDVRRQIYEGVEKWTNKNMVE